LPLSFGDYLAGLAFFLGTVGPACLAAALLIRRRFPELRGTVRAVAFGLLATAAIIAVHLLPGLVGALSRWSALACSFALLGAVALIRPREPIPPSSPPGPRSERGLDTWILPALAVGALAVWALAVAWTASGQPSAEVDTLTFHLPGVARWMQTGDLWHVDQFAPLWAFGNYPQNGDVAFLAVVQPWGNDAFARLWSIPWAVLAGISVYAIALEARAPQPTAALLGAVFGSLPALLVVTVEGAKTDAIMLGCLGGGLLFLVRHFRTGRRSDLLLAGLGLGLAFGTKWYGVSGVPVILAVWAGLWLLARKPVGDLLRSMAAVAALIAGAGGFWLLRNLVDSGNPVFPTKVAPLGVTLFDAPRNFLQECGGFTIAHYLDRPSIWRTYVLPAYRDSFGAPGLLIVVAALLGAGFLVRGFRRRQAGSEPEFTGPLLLICAAVLAAVYAVTPYSAFGPADRPILVGADARWLLPTFLCAAAVSAWAGGQLGRFRRPFEALAAIVVIDGIRRAFHEPLATLAVAAGVLVPLVAVALLSIRLGRKRVLLAGGTAVALSAVGVGYARQREFNDGRYAGEDPAIAWFVTHPAKRKVGLAGDWTTGGLSPVLPAFGPRLENVVHYVGRTVDGQLRRYGNRESFVGAVERGGYDVLLVGKAQFRVCRAPGSAATENAWARSAGFRKLAESDRLVLYRVST
jgi:hypothetical protein